MRWRNSWQLKAASDRTADAYAQLLKQLRQQESEVAEVASNLTADAYAQLLKQLRQQESEVAEVASNLTADATYAHIYNRNKKCHPRGGNFCE